MHDFRRPAEHSAALQGWDAPILELLPAAVYVCDASGEITRFNRRAEELWGRAPKIGDSCDRFCGAYRLFLPSGEPLRHEDTPMAETLRTGKAFRNIEVQIEQPSGRRIWAQVNIDPIRAEDGTILGAINSFQDVSDQKEHERELRQNRNLLEAIIDTTPQCVKVVAADGSILFMNHAGLTAIKARTLADVPDRSVYALIAPEHRDAWQANHLRVCAGERVSWEFDVVSLDGTRRHMASHAAPLEWIDERIVQLAITRDVTQRKRDEDALRASELRWRTLLENLPGAIYVTDAAGRITFYNDACVQLAGRVPELGSDRWCVTWKLYRPDGSHLPHDECPMALALRTGRPIRGEEAVAERPDGSRVPFLAYPTPIFNQHGELAGAINMLMDITDRKHADEYAELLAAIVMSSNDAIIGMDLEGIVTSWNDSAERLYGYRADEMLGKPVTLLIPEDRADDEPEILRRIRRGERVEHFETRRIRKDGSPVDISLTVSPVRNGNGEVIGASKIARDISERKREEERRKLLLNELNHRVKNTLATVQAIASQTFGNVDADAPARFEQRLIALSHAHNVLTEENWEGADFADIVQRAIAGFAASHDEGRFEVSGPRMWLPPRTALSLALALHELCTNAAKYGALSNRAGRVRIEWLRIERSAGAVLHIQWRERSGPPVALPTHTGFGTRMLQRALVLDLGARVELRYDPGGLCCEIEVPMDVPSD